MKIKQAIPVLLAAGFIFTGQINSANAYFTTYVTARGGYELSWWHEEDIKEEFGNWNKTVTISSKEGSIPVFVRARAFAGSDHQLTYDGGSGWTAGTDGYYYYNDALYSGQTTTGLIVGIPDTKLKTPRLGDNFNVSVVYETIPAEFDDNGAPINAASAKWDNPIGAVTEDHDGTLQSDDTNNGGGEDNE
ncbi:MAG: hypothetical protein HUJ71_00720 [Pseudobutyrivibrio sp.]|nr:hypothetical protein [Pseudobutyrivibrio sp.]